MSEEVLIQFADRVAVITINRPRVRNAVNRAVSEAIAAAVDELDGREDLAVGILTGSGGTFCSGMDLKAFAQGESPRIPGRGFGGITEAPPRKPLIAAVEGAAVAGGCELALSADLIVAARTASFGLPEVKRGLVAAAGGLLRLPKAAPYQVAMRMALTGEPISATEAHTYGLVAELTEDGGALSAAWKLAIGIAANGPLAIQATKRIVSAGTAWTDQQQWQVMRSIAEPVLYSSDAREGARAFAEKRPPQWRGR